MRPSLLQADGLVEGNPLRDGEVLGFDADMLCAALDAGSRSRGEQPALGHRDAHALRFRLGLLRVAAIDKETGRGPASITPALPVKPQR